MVKTKASFISPKLLLRTNELPDDDDLWSAKILSLGEMAEHQWLADCAILPNMLSNLMNLLRSVCGVFLDLSVFLRLNLRSRPALAAENLFLRKQLALYVERKKKPRCATNAARFTLGRLSRFFQWPDALTVVKPGTLIRWHLFFLCFRRYRIFG
jgi:hypothetical protein